eukprot:TRINITY_DN59639_c0_g1_i1.p1 TRINITY_DN59639_c0_g1~~TRINITY_DN59639_c0_g1_i1.p1  ORF type:complete len:175 (+),score=19.85 TRINITY_DN59639_c0_g1_i1:82-606(+)
MVSLWNGTVSASTCGNGELGAAFRQAFECDTASIAKQAVSKPLRKRVVAAARVGFRRDILKRALIDALQLQAIWKTFVPDFGTFVPSGEVPKSAGAFVTQLLKSPGYAAAIAGPDTYCLYAHATAIFVSVRFRPLFFACEQAASQRMCSKDKQSSWITQTAHRSRHVRLPPAVA